MIKRRRFLLLLTAGTALAVTGCGTTSGGSSGGATSKSGGTSRAVFTEHEVDQLVTLTSSKDVKNANVRGVMGRVFNIERQGDITAAQMWTDPDDSEGNLIVILDSSGPAVHEDDYLRVTGSGIDVFKGKNALGGEVQVPRIRATSWSLVNATALDPALKTYTLNKTRSLSGVDITVRKIEISKKETRVYVRYDNQSSDDFTADVSLTANTEQIDDSFESELDPPASSVSTGATSSGVLTFKPVSVDKTLDLTYKGFDADFNGVKVEFSTDDTAPAASKPSSASTATTATTADLRSCDQNISASTATTCGFADAVFKDYARKIQAGQGPSLDMHARSPTTGELYAITCAAAGTTITCTGGAGAVVTFPYKAAAVY